MDSPVRKTAAGIIGKAKTAVSLVNSKFLALKLPPAATPNQSVGSLFAMALAHGKTHTADSIILESALIRRSAKVTMTECEEQLFGLKKSANHWFALSDFLKGESQTLPLETPEYMARAATLIKSAATSGTIPAVTLLTLIDEINRNAMTSLSYLSETEKRLARIKSAGGVAVAAQTEAFLTKIAKHEGFTKKDQARLKRHIPFVAKVASERRLQHAAQHFEPHQFKRVYKNYEVEVQL